MENRYIQIEKPINRKQIKIKGMDLFFHIILKGIKYGLLQKVYLTGFFSLLACLSLLGHNKFNKNFYDTTERKDDRIYYSPGLFFSLH